MLTKAQRRMLSWFDENGPAGAIPCEVGSLALVRRLVARGLLAEVGREPSFIGFIKLNITDAGRAALSAAPGREEG